jgi:hypothetical protein
MSNRGKSDKSSPGFRSLGTNVSHGRQGNHGFRSRRDSLSVRRNHHRGFRNTRAGRPTQNLKEGLKEWKGSTESEAGGLWAA